MKTFRFLRAGLIAALIAVAGLVMAPPASAQTALNTTTLSAAVAETSNVVPLASLSNIAAGDILFVDREAMQVQTVNAASVNVTRGVQGTAAAPHVTAALVYTGAPRRFSAGPPKQGACTRGSEQFLPRIVLNGGDVWDCPVGAGVWTLLNDRATMTSRSVWFNIDNGAGTTIDDVLLRPARPIRITACRIVYVDATAGTVAAGTASVGTTVGGVDIVAATAYTNSATVGATTAMTVVSGAVAAGGAVFVRHTGVATTAAGQAVVECDWHYR